VLNQKLVLPMIFVLVVILFSGVESASAEGEVGVSVGQTAEYTYAISISYRSTINGSLLASVPYQVGYIEAITVQEISGTNITLESVKTYVNDQTNETNLGWVDISTGDGPASGYIILADCNEGDLIYPNWEGGTEDLLYVYMINETILMKDGDATIEVNHANLTTTIDNQTISMNYYWEKATGLLIGNTWRGTLEQENVTQSTCYHYQRVGLPQVFQPLIDRADYPVTVDSSSAILGFAFNQSEKQISLHVSGSTGTSGFCDVTIPDDLLWGTFSLNLDGFPLVEDVDYTQTHNSTHYNFHITYSYSAQMIEIVGSDAIPEFPAWIILPTFMVVTLAAAFLYRKNYDRTVDSIN
jgi:hypothetical protein